MEEGGFTLIDIEHPQPALEDVRTTMENLRKAAERTRSTPWVVLDGYHFDPTYQRALRNAGAKLLVIDDHAHLPWYEADILLNHAHGAEKLDYPCASSTKLLLGSRYALIRPEFIASMERRKKIPAVARNILVTLGGSDPENVSLKILQALLTIDNGSLEIRVVAGPLNAHVEHLRGQFSNGANPIQFETDVGDMAPLMQWADLGITAAGGTCWELCCLGVPMATVIVAQNQEAIAAALAGAGASVNLGWHHRLSVEQAAKAIREIVHRPDERSEMSARGRALVDGQGVGRVISVMLQETGLRAA